MLFEILKNFFTTGEQGKKAFDVIKKALVAGVLIQASWFLMGALIDISTIATYSIGGMPISILQSDNQCAADLGNTVLLPIGSKVDFSASSQVTAFDESFRYYYFVQENDTKTYFSPCEVYNNRRVIGQKYRGTYQGITYEKDYCILPNNMFAYFGTTLQLAANSDVMMELFDVSIPPLDELTYLDYRSNLHNIITAGSGIAMNSAGQRQTWLDD